MGDTVSPSKTPHVIGNRGLDHRLVETKACRWSHISVTYYITDEGICK